MLEPQVYRGVVPSVQQVSDEPVIEVEETTDEYARIVAAPLPPGFGITLGNALRRALLSSLTGAAVSSVRIDGVQHEFSTIPHVKEDTIEFLLNVKEMRLRALSDRPGTMILDISGREGTITAANLVGPLAGHPLSDLIAEMRAGNTYTNVHTNDGVAPPNTGPGDFPGGEIRGQISEAGPN